MSIRLASAAPACLLALASLLSLTSRGHALTQAPPEATKAAAGRTDLPVKMVKLPDGARRFTVQITIGSTQVETGLDTGSVGLRVLPGTLKEGDAKATDEPDNMRYGGGAMYDGTISVAKIDIGGITGKVRFQQVEKVGCAPRKPDCLAGKIPLSEYGIMGDGISGAGFKAIIGVAKKDMNLSNPLRALGVSRFIVELPRDESETGHLILNPTAEDSKGFVKVPPYKRIAEQKALTDDTVNGCISAIAEGKKFCGAVTFDSGAPGITIASPDPLGEAWPAGTKANVVLDDGTGNPLVTDDFVVGSTEDAAHLRFVQVDFMPKTVIRMGIGPYFTYSVLYDLDRGGLAVRPRKPRS